MPTFNDHEAQAISNIDFSKEILSLSGEDGLRFPDWYSTVCFYSAVHVIEAEIYQMTTVHCVINGKDVAFNNKIRHSQDFRKFLDKTTLPTSPHFYRRLVIDNPDNDFPEEVVKAYNSLFEYSYNARYNCYKDCHKHVMNAKKSLETILKFHKSKYESAIP